MKKLSALALLLLLSCSPKIIERVEREVVTEYRDSLVYKDTTLYVPIPVESHSDVTHCSDTSKLETSLAYSEAWVDSIGLHHKLENKRGNWGVPLKYPKRTIVSTATTTDKQTITVTKLVEKELSFFQKVKMSGFWILLLILVVTYRQQLFQLGKKVLPLLKNFIKII